MQSHLASFESDLRAAGCEGEVLISTSSGGVMHVDDVVAKPIYTVKSGPAMGPLAGIAYAGAEDQGDDVIIVDTGGTTFDVSLVRSGQVKYTRDTWLLGEWIGHNLGLSSVDVQERRRGRRLHRLDRCRRAAPRRPAERGRAPRPRLLRPGR